jgi:hypothetical protein
MGHFATFSRISPTHTRWFNITDTNAAQQQPVSYFYNHNDAATACNKVWRIFLKVLSSRAYFSRKDAEFSFQLSISKYTLAVFLKLSFNSAYLGE